MATITINGTECEFEPGQTILQVANAHGLTIPQYCYHDGLSIVASCRICLAEVWAPNPRNEGKLEPIPKLLPTCQTPAADGQVVYSDSPKSTANQKAVMEYLLINHPLDCPVCDQSGECFLQDYSYEYGRGASRFEEQKVKQPKKDLGPNVWLYSDRCIMCSRCVRFTREVTGTSELIVEGRGNRSEIDVFPGEALDNELSANVIDLCPVGALLDKDFLFAQRVWFLKSTPSIDGLTASGDNILVEHNEGRVYRFKPRTNLAVNKWWITDEVRYGWKFVHREDRLEAPRRTREGRLVDSDWNRAIGDAVDGVRGALGGGGRLAVMVSPMLTCEEAFELRGMARELDDGAVVGVGPVPRDGEDKVFPPGADDGFRMYAEKAPNARGVRRVLEAGGGTAPGYDALLETIRGGDVRAVILTGGYPSEWATDELLAALEGKFVVVIDVLPGKLTARADVVLPGSAWVEKAGTFENAKGLLQAFEAAVPAPGLAKQEGQIAMDIAAEAAGAPRVISAEAMLGRRVIVDEGPGQAPAQVTRPAPRSSLFNAADTRSRMAAGDDALGVFVTDVSMPSVEAQREPDMEMVEL